MPQLSVHLCVGGRARARVCLCLWLCGERSRSMLTPSLWHVNVESPVKPSLQETVQDFPSSTCRQLRVSITI